MQSSWSSNNTPQSQHDRVHPKFLANRLFEATRSETPMDSVTLWIYSNVYGKMKNDNFKNADGVVTEQDGLQTGLLLERTELNHKVFRILFPLFHSQIQVTLTEVILQRQKYNFQYEHINSCHGAICVTQVTVDIFIYRYISLNLSTFSFHFVLRQSPPTTWKPNQHVQRRTSIQGDLGATRWLLKTVVYVDNFCNLIAIAMCYVNSTYNCFKISIYS